MIDVEIGTITPEGLVWDGYRWLNLLPENPTEGQTMNVTPNGEMWITCTYQNNMWQADNTFKYFTLNDSEPQNVLRLTRSKSTFNTLTIYNNNGSFIEIDVNTGEHTFGENVNISEMAEIFWNCVSSHAFLSIGQSRTDTKILDDIRKMLKLKEGENIFDCIQELISYRDTNQKTEPNNYERAMKVLGDFYGKE